MYHKEQKLSQVNSRKRGPPQGSCRDLGQDGAGAPGELLSGRSEGTFAMAVTMTVGTAANSPDEENQFRSSRGNLNGTAKSRTVCKMGLGGRCECLGREGEETY